MKPPTERRARIVVINDDTDFLSLMSELLTEVGEYDVEVCREGNHAYQFVKEHAAPDDINAVVLLTDGRNEDDGISVDNLLSQVRTEEGARSVRLFTIGYGEDADLDTLRRISDTTNAATYDSSDPTSIDQVFTAVVSNF